MKTLQFDSQFLREHMEELIHLEDYIPEVSFIVYDKHYERYDFLKSKNLLGTIKEMNQVLDEKCKHSKHPILARNSIIVEWLDWHPEFEGIIAKESWNDYQQIKNNNEFTFNDLLHDVELPSEKQKQVKYEYRDEIIHKDDSNRMFSDFKKINEIYERYSGLLAVYLVYLV